MNTFEEAQREAREARLKIQEIEAAARQTEQALSKQRVEFVAYEEHATETLAGYRDALSAQRERLQRALQRQSDAPITPPDEHAVAEAEPIANVQTYDEHQAAPIYGT